MTPFPPRTEKTTSYLHSTVTAHVAALTLMESTKLSTTVQSILDRVAEYCEAATSLMDGKGHPVTRALIHNTQGERCCWLNARVRHCSEAVGVMSAIIQAIQGEPAEAIACSELISKVVTDKLDPPPPPPSFLPEIWAAEAQTFPLDEATIKHGVARNVRVFERGAVGFGGLMEGGVDHITPIQLKKAYKAQAGATFGKDAGDASVSELQAGYCLKATERVGAEASVMDSPKDHFDTALAFARQKGNKYMIAAALRSLAELCREAMDAEGELQHLKELERLVRDLPDKGWYADCCRRLISLYTRLSKGTPAAAPPVSPAMSAMSQQSHSSSSRSSGMSVMSDDFAGTLTYEEIEERGAGGPGNEDFLTKNGKKLAGHYLNVYEELIQSLEWKFTSQVLPSSS
jgi:hypothetical protein